MSWYRDLHSVFVVRSCDSACRFCTQRSGSDGVRPLAEVQADIRWASQHRKPHLALTGGEPTLHPELLECVQFAGELGFAEILLETHGAHLTPALVAELARAGLTRIELNAVSVPWAAEFSWGQPTVPDFDSFVEAARSAAVQLWLRFPASVSTAPLAGRFLDWLEKGGSASPAVLCDGLILDWLPSLHRAKLEGTATGEWLLPDAFQALHHEFRKRADGRGWPLRVDSFRGVPPCLLPFSAELAPLARRWSEVARHLPPGQTERIALCERCSWREICPGLPAELEPALPSEALHLPAPVEVFDRASRKEKDLHQRGFDLSIVDSEMGRSAIVRVNYRCQMRCEFCWVDLYGGEKSLELVRREVAHAWQEGATHLFLSGGEPTLSPFLPQIIAEARELGYSTRSLETNAMLLRQPQRVEALVEAGLNAAFVSLHATQPELSDEITKAPGGFLQTVEGVRQLVLHDVRVILNFVAYPRNLGELSLLPGFLRQKFGELPNRPVLRISVAQPINAEVDPTSVPRYREVAPLLLESLEEFLEWGVSGANLSGMCGMPPCALGGEERFFPAQALLSQSTRQENFQHVAACAECRLREVCPGVRRAYLSLFGEDEFQPVR